MALTAADVHLWSELKRLDAIPAAPSSLLEIGEGNWWGDVPLQDGQPEEPFEAAAWFYDRTLGQGRRVAIDMHGTKRAIKWDLNGPLPKRADGIIDFGGQFDIVVNSGTAEHVFDQRQLFETFNYCCKVGGLMIHAAPLTGWLQHGFYCYQPCFFADMAVANGYKTLLMFWWEVQSGKIGTGPEWPLAGVDSMLYVALRKEKDAPFAVPRQGRYA